MALLEQEHLRVILLNTRNQVLSIPEVYKGNVSSALVRVAEVLRGAVREGSPALIVVHNHPSGDPTPSQDDVEISKQLIEAGQLLGVEVLDHIILAHGGFVSLREQGLGFPRA
jgi:DNA repair protein RadC